MDIKETFTDEAAALVFETMEEEEFAHLQAQARLELAETDLDPQGPAAEIIGGLIVKGYIAGAFWGLESAPLDEPTFDLTPAGEEATGGLLGREEEPDDGLVHIAMTPRQAELFIQVILGGE